MTAMTAWMRRIGSGGILGDRDKINLKDHHRGRFVGDVNPDETLRVIPCGIRHRDKFPSAEYAPAPQWDYGRITAIRIVSGSVRSV